MNIKPIGDRVLVEMLPEQVAAKGVIVPAATVDKERLQPLERGIVRGVGTKCTLPIAIGDTVHVLTNHGMELPGTDCRMFFSPHVQILEVANG